jgi:hypothetical protein
MENWYKIAQEQKTDPQRQEIVTALETINNTVAIINKSLETIQNDNVMQLFTKDSLVQSILSGNTTTLTATSVQPSLDAMDNISKSIVVINKNIRILQNNEANAVKLGINVGDIQQQVMDTIQSGQYAQYSSTMQAFIQNLSQMSNTTD